MTVNTSPASQPALVEVAFEMHPELLRNKWGSSAVLAALGRKNPFHKRTVLVLALKPEWMPK